MPFSISARNRFSLIPLGTKFAGQVVFERAGFEIPTEIGAEFEPIEDARSGFSALEEELDAAEAALAQLCKRRVMVGRHEHDEVGHRTVHEAVFAVEEIHPERDGGSAGGVGDAGKSSPLFLFGVI